jgi:hypothetical protein
MKLVLLRDRLTEKSTCGKLMWGDQHVSYTLEDVHRVGPKLPGETCIPNGIYEVVVTHSPRFGIDMPLLLNVPGFSGVRIHSGNKPEHTEGCILVGTTRGPDQVLGSRIAYEEVFKLIQAARARGESVTLEVKLAPKEP